MMGFIPSVLPLVDATTAVDAFGCLITDSACCAIGGRPTWRNSADASQSCNHHTSGYAERIQLTCAASAVMATGPRFQARPPGSYDGTGVSVIFALVYKVAVDIFSEYLGPVTEPLVVAHR